MKQLHSVLFLLNIDRGTGSAKWDQRIDPSQSHPIRFHEFQQVRLHDPARNQESGIIYFRPSQVDLL